MVGKHDRDRFRPREFDELRHIKVIESYRTFDGVKQFSSVEFFRKRMETPANQLVEFFRRRELPDKGAELSSKFGDA